MPASDWTYVSNNVTQGTSADVYKELRKACPKLVPYTIYQVLTYFVGVSGTLALDNPKESLMQSSVSAF